MTVMFQLPGDLEQRLRAETPDLNDAAKEAALVELYRQDRISHYELSQALGLSRWETDAVLQKHHVTEDMPTSQELEEDFRRLSELLRR
jgi:Uncharacterised protein family (UPF0175)